MENVHVNIRFFGQSKKVTKNKLQSDLYLTKRSVSLENIVKNHDSLLIPSDPFIKVYIMGFFLQILPYFEENSILSFYLHYLF